MRTGGWEQEKWGGGHSEREGWNYLNAMFLLQAMILLKKIWEFGGYVTNNRFSESILLFKVIKWGRITKIFHANCIHINK